MTWLRRAPWIPGVLVAVGLWSWVLVRIDFASDAQQNIDMLWQSLGSGLLEADPVGSILVLHIQPPMMNTLFALDGLLTPGSHLFLLALNLLAMIASIALLVDALVRVSVSPLFAAVAGVMYALLPATVAYSFWVYNVTLTSFLAIAAVWGVAFARSRPPVGVAASGLAVLGLVLTRSTFALPILVLWLLALGWLISRSGSSRGLVALVAIAVFGVLVQIHYFANFGQITMSSWGGQNVLNATRTSGVLNVTEQARRAIAKDPCAEAALAAFEAERLNLWDPGGLISLPACADLSVPLERGIPAWDEQFRPENEELNLNWRYGLASSRVWTSIAVDVVRSDPLQLVRMSVAPPGGPLNSGVARYMSRSENYPWVEASAHSLPASNIFETYSSFFAPVAWAIVVVGWLSALLSRGWRWKTHPAYWFASALIAFHLSASTLLEYAEAMRFRAEVDAVLMFAAVTTCWIFYSRLRSRWT